MKINELKIGICGLGLIGGSLAKALKTKSKINDISAFDVNETFLVTAFNEGIISMFSNNSFNIFENCDIVFVCTPVLTVLSNIREISKHTNAIITDVGSTKFEILNKTKDYNFIGGHPMAGSEKSGYFASDEALFENAIYVLCKGEKANASSLNILRELVSSIGAIPLEMDALEHDKAVGIISHLPHILSASLVNTAIDNNNKNIMKLVAGGFKDITRISSSNPKLWKEIIISSSDVISKILDDYIEKLIDIKNSISKNDSEKILSLFTNAKKYRDEISENSKGLISTYYELRIDVNDKPGIIGYIATLFGKNEINIKNLNIQHTRDYEGGCLRFTFDNKEQTTKAKELLTKNGFVCY